MRWDDALKDQFTLDGRPGGVISGKAAGKTLTLTLSAGTAARTITYLDSKAWSENRLLYGENGHRRAHLLRSSVG